MAKIKYLLWAGTGFVGSWYVLLFATAFVQSERPRTYGEDLSGIGTLFMIPFAILLLQVPTIVLGLTAALVFRLSTKRPIDDQGKFEFCLAAFCILSVPVLVFISQYVIADM